MPGHRIRTDLTGNRLTCRFRTEGLLRGGAPVYFGSRETAGDAPRLAAILEAAGASAAKVAGGTISLTREDYEDWPSVCRAVAPLILAALDSGGPLVPDAVPGNIPSDEEIRDRVERVLASEVNPSVSSHGGLIELDGVREATVFVRMSGGCRGCAHSRMTLRMGVERALRATVPEIDDVVDVTDHGAGHPPS